MTHGVTKQDVIEAAKTNTFESHQVLAYKYWRQYTELGWTRFDADTNWLLAEYGMNLYHVMPERFAKAVEAK